MFCVKVKPRRLDDKDWAWALERGRIETIEGVRVALLGASDYVLESPTRLVSINGTYIEGLRNKDPALKERGVRWSCEQRADGRWHLSNDELARIALELLTRRVFDVEGNPLSFHGVLKVAKDRAEDLERWCNEPPGRDNCGRKDEPLYDEEFTFADGIRMAVQVCPSTNPDEEECWTQGVLFTPDGVELGCTDVGESFVGDYEIEHNGRWYCVEVQVD